jgi:superfamily II DNA or RNA helicase
MTSSLQYTQQDIEYHFEQRALHAAPALIESIIKIKVEKNHVWSELRPPEFRSVEVDIYFDERQAKGKRYLSIESECTCPTLNNCMHAAAVLLYMLEQQAKSDSDPASDFEQLLLGASRAINLNSLNFFNSPIAMPASPHPGLLQWVDTLRLASQEAGKKPKAKAKATQAIYYLLGHSIYYQYFILQTVKGRIDPAAPQRRSTTTWNGGERSLLSPPQFTDDSDTEIFRQMLKICGKKGYFDDNAPLSGKPGAALLAAALGTGRCYFCLDMAQPHSAPLTLLRAGLPRYGDITWQSNKRQQIVPHLLTRPPSSIRLPLVPPWYIDPESGEAGPVDSKTAAVLLDALFRLPPLDPGDLPLVASALAELAPDIPPPHADAVHHLRQIDVPLQPIITLRTQPCWAIRKHRQYVNTFSSGYYDYAQIVFVYGETQLPALDPQDYLTLSSGETVHVKRNDADEKTQLALLASLGFQPVVPSWISVAGGFAPSAYGLASEAAWLPFSCEMAPKLQAAGWQVVFSHEFRHHILTVDSWDAKLSDSEAGWFGLDMGIVVNGERLPLAPLLHSLFHSDGRWLDGERIAHIADDETIELTGPQGGRIRLAAERIKQLAHTLIDLFDDPLGSSTLRLSRADAGRLASLGDLPDWSVHGTPATRELVHRLQEAGDTHTACPPQGLAMTLRPYQLDGLGWLQYLRENKLGGILADDMGLGKTAQTLAHLLIEKEAGRLDKPALIVMPTSLIFNWKREAERFAPGLSVLSLHGARRAEHFAAIPEHDVCLTTYPLLWRDRALLGIHAYHLLILDEAQIIKNSTSQAAQVVRQFRATHRLCLTGTPLENHLGELWGLFDFLMPGFLGDAKHFTATWRTPIEKQGNTLRRALLARRIKPFMLRRKKDEVAKELPEKTIIVRSVELEGGQRDLYETVRSAMDARVREEIAAKGFARSQIVILDALLKLRQVCCDPRLVKIDAAKKVKERAKLNLLLDMLPEMVEEGRRVLLFSQFTSMLDLIAEQLVSRKIDFVTLTGSTTDRATPVRRFQDGEVPVFLISLKAGGTGLNLTAADTVIHYDPWWNPAVENQATDRAHRLGQSKKVFVYKLVVAGSIEEKILALQEKKAELAASILSEDHEGSVKFSDSDLAALLEAIPEKGL